MFMPPLRPHRAPCTAPPPATAGTTWRVASPVYSPRSSTRVSAVGGGRGGGREQGEGVQWQGEKLHRGERKAVGGAGHRDAERSGGEVNKPRPAFDLTAPLSPPNRRRRRIAVHAWRVTLCAPPSPPLTAGADALLSMPGVSLTAPPRCPLPPHRRRRRITLHAWRVTLCAGPHCRRQGPRLPVPWGQEGTRAALVTGVRKCGVCGAE